MSNLGPLGRSMFGEERMDVGQDQRRDSRAFGDSPIGSALRDVTGGGALMETDSGVIPRRSTEIEQEYLVVLEIDRLDVAFTQAGDAGFAGWLVGHFPDTELIEIAMTFHESFAVQAFLPLNGSLNMLNTLNLGTNDITGVVDLTMTGLLTVGGIAASGNLTMSGNDILGVGDLGIGTSDPNKPLHVLSSTSPAGALIECTAANGIVNLCMENDNGKWILQVDTDDHFKLVDNDASPLDVMTVELGAPADSIYVESSGDVGFGTNAPTERIHCKAASGSLGIFVQTGDATPVDLLLANSVRNWSAGVASTGDFAYNDITGSLIPIVFSLATPSFTIVTKGTTGFVGINTFTPTSHFDVAGSVGAKVTTTGASTFTAADEHTIYCTADCTVSLPAIASNTTRIYNVISAAGFTVTLDPNSSETVDGSTTVSFSGGDVLTVQPNTATNWKII